MGHGFSIGTSERSHSRRSLASRLILRSRATAVRGGGVPAVVRGRESRPHVIVPLPDSISASALAAPSAPMIQKHGEAAQGIDRGDSARCRQQQRFDGTKVRPLALANRWIILLARALVKKFAQEYLLGSPNLRVLRGWHRPRRRCWRSSREFHAEACARTPG